MNRVTGVSPVQLRTTGETPVTRKMQIETRQGGARSALSASLSDGEVALAWLGQAGFLIRSDSVSLLIDPYLSDALAEKYRGSDKSHERMTAAPVTVQELTSIDFVFCTHRHGDHMDWPTLNALAENAKTRFVLPVAEVEFAKKNGLTEAQIIAVDASSGPLSLRERAGVRGGATIDVNSIKNADSSVGPHPNPLPEGEGTRLTFTVLPAAHEKLERDESGRHRFLGYSISLNGLTIYHSGDCVPFDGLTEHVSKLRADLALLPVNGRGKGVAGNFTLGEAIQLCRDAKIAAVITHHFEMFSFNTVSRDELETQASRVSDIRCLIPKTSEWLLLRKE